MLPFKNQVWVTEPSLKCLVKLGYLKKKMPCLHKKHTLFDQIFQMRFTNPLNYYHKVNISNKKVRKT